MRKVRGFTLIELMIVVAIIGVLAAIAIPSFMKYIRRSKTSEAVMNLRKMYDGAVAYYLSEHADASGTMIARQFPTSAPLTPATPPPAKRVNTAPADWKVGGWVALDFMVSDAQFFSYQFDAKGSPAHDASMIAHGDLNGNGVWSTFERDIHGTTDGVQGGLALYTIAELE